MNNSPKNYAADALIKIPVVNSDVTKRKIMNNFLSERYFVSKCGETNGRLSVNCSIYPPSLLGSQIDSST